MLNHLVVGLGGNGGKIIRSFRKLIYQNHRAEDPPGVNIRYLYVDSSDEMMAHDDPTWKILGTSVQLQSGTSQLRIKGIIFAELIQAAAASRAALLLWFMGFYFTRKMIRQRPASRFAHCVDSQDRKWRKTDLYCRGV